MAPSVLNILYPVCCCRYFWQLQMIFTSLNKTSKVKTLQTKTWGCAALKSILFRTPGQGYTFQKFLSQKGQNLIGSCLQSADSIIQLVIKII